MSDGKLKGLLLAIVAIASIAAIGIYYQRVVQPREPVWDELDRTWPEGAPLAVGVEDGLEVQPAVAAVAFWNESVGCELFQLADGGDPQVVLRLSSSTATCGGAAVLGGHERAGTWLCAGPSPRAEVLVGGPGTIDELYRILAHELGHVLSLAHDAAPASVMRNPMGDDPLIRVSDKDAAALRSRYCQ